MQKGVSFFLTILFILPLILFSVESSAQEIEEKMVVVKGTDDWKNTKIKLYPQDKVTIRASGQICFSSQYCNIAKVDADGWDKNTYQADWPGDYAYCFDPLRQVNHAALIGNVGSDDFFIGKDANFTGKDGVLYLRVNDCSLTGDFGNSGQFEVFISVKHFK
ncbi:MAG: hypothetical protein KJN64_09255 [Ignavibacteria bacterium]|nr:hypothetical protein [Ignavibacteria bacterium]MBT8381885.1 hypothetical protein [Ignavibacteria bacterium]MBT8391063.1 hypothetical protein [Ignavibacteria bacterium]NNJ54462.1 hypothetical protein [Ignavibacteriaceae bacterium]NNL21849.1 hypothetical protein [Ignavibacteriaceae bacterium]